MASQLQRRANLVHLLLQWITHTCCVELESWRKNLVCIASTSVKRNVLIEASSYRNLYYGSNGANYVFSFLPVSGTITSFSTDLKPFFTVSSRSIRAGHYANHFVALQYLTTSQGLPTSQYLTTAQGGTEPTSGGPVTLTTSAFKLVIT